MKMFRMKDGQLLELTEGEEPGSSVWIEVDAKHICCATCKYLGEGSQSLECRYYPITHAGFPTISAPKQTWCRCWTKREITAQQLDIQTSG